MSAAVATTLRTLAARVGVLESYVDNTGVERETSDETREALLAALGYEAGDEISAARTLAALEEEVSSYIVDPVRVTPAVDAVRVEARSLTFGPGTLDYEIVANAEIGSGRHAAHGQARVAIDGTISGLRAPLLAPGTYQLEIRLERSGVHRTAEQWVAVVPSTCTPLEEVIGDRRAFGIWANLYSLRCRRGLGIGNVSDLEALTRFAAQHGADFVGLNPLHALRNHGHEISPYGPVSRLFRNPLYIDVMRVSEFAACSEARALLRAEGVARELERARLSDRIDYERVARLQRPLLEALWRTFRKRQDTGRAAAFDRYRSRMGTLLRDFGTFCVLEEKLVTTGAPRDWRRWPAELRDHASKAVSEFRERHADEVEFHAWVQFELDRQLASVARTARRAGMALGLYTDLAVGSLASSFDAWAFPGPFLDSVHVGAPPDAYSATGQDWNLPALHPHRLRADRFRYWRLLVAAALDHCGMLRLDHAMGVLRQFWIPFGRSGTQGAYVSFPAEDLLGLLALESRARGTVVVAEDLGTVPKGFGALLQRYRVLSSQVMFFERTVDGGFVRSSSYSNRALLTANTHDQATLAGWWNARDLEIRRTVGMIATEEDMAVALSARVRERELLLRRLQAENVLPGAEVRVDAARVSRATYRYLAAAPSPLLGISLDDLALETEPVNVPGISVEMYPSWSRRMRAEFSDLARSVDAAAVLEGVGPRARGRRHMR